MTIADTPGYTYSERKVHLILDKEKTFDTFKEFHALVERQTNQRPRKLQTDNGGEFESSKFNQYCQIRGIAREFTAPYSSSQNGVAKRKNRTIQDMTRALIKKSNLHLAYWGEVVSMTTYLQNRLPSKAIDGMTPYKAWHGRKPTLQHIRIFGAPAYTHKSKDQLEHSKLFDIAQKYIFWVLLTALRCTNFMTLQPKWCIPKVPNLMRRQL